MLITEQLQQQGKEVENCRTKVNGKSCKFTGIITGMGPPTEMSPFNTLPHPLLGVQYHLRQKFWSVQLPDSTEWRAETGTLGCLIDGGVGIVRRAGKMLKA